MAETMTRDLSRHKGVRQNTKILTLTTVVPKDVTAAWNWIADQDYRVARVDEVHTIAGIETGSITVAVKAAGVSSNTFDLKGVAANTITTKTDPNIWAAGSKTIAKGDAVLLVFSGTLTTVRGVMVTLLLVPESDKKLGTGDKLRVIEETST